MKENICEIIIGHKEPEFYIEIAMGLADFSNEIQIRYLYPRDVVKASKVINQLKMKGLQEITQREVIETYPKIMKGSESKKEEFVDKTHKVKTAIVRLVKDAF